MQSDDVRRELDQLAARLARIEAMLQLEFSWTTSETELPPIVQPPPIASAIQPALTAKPNEPDLDEKCQSFKRLQVDWRKQSDQGKSFAPATEPVSAPPPLRPRPAAPGQISKPQPTGFSAAPFREPLETFHSKSASQSLEMLIGGKWMAWLGALTVLLAVAFAIMVGVKHGWWGRIPPEVRCIAIALFGGVLLVSGEISLRRLGPAASVGLLSAGLGTLYMDAFATFRFFNLLSSEWAFVLMAIVAVIGFALTLRTRFITIGVLSMLGGYLTPILLRGQSAHDLELLSYLTMLLAISLGLSAALPREFRSLRFIALGGQAIVGGLWILGNASSPTGAWLLGIFFTSVWWAMMLGESLYAAMRRQTAMANIVAVVLATAAFVIAGCWVLNFGPTTPGFAKGTIGASMSGLVVANWLGLFTICVALLGAITAFQFGPPIKELGFAPRTAIDRFALAVWAQSGVLLIVAIGLQFRGYAQTVGWLAVSLAAIEVGRRLRARGLTVFGLIAGGLALARVVLLDWWVTKGMNSPLWTFGDVTITRWALLAIGTIIVMHIAAHRIWTPARKSRETLPILLASLATAGWMIVCVAQAQGLAITAGWSIGVAILLALDRIGRRQAYAEIALFSLTLTAVWWIASDAFGTRLEDGWDGTAMMPLINWQVGLALAIVVQFFWARHVLRRNNSNESHPAHPNLVSLWQALPALTAVFALVALSFEVDRALAQNTTPAEWIAVWNPTQLRGLMMTALWCAGGLALFIAGRARQAQYTIGTGVLIVAGAALMWLTFDSLAWRVSEGVVRTTVVLNLQFVVGGICATVLAITAGLMRRDAHEAPESLREQLIIRSAICIALLGVIGIVLGSLEIDRYFAAVPMHRQAGLSVFWATYAVMLVTIGFIKASPIVRYCGLGLLAIVAGKVVLVDFAYLDDLPRVISTLVAGLLFIGTSMLYFKLSPLLKANAASER